jgi:hypothetical protein
MDAPEAVHWKVKVKTRYVAHMALRNACTIFMTGPYFDLGGNIKMGLGKIIRKVVNSI